MNSKRKLKYAMVGGAKGSFIGPIHRSSVRLDNLATLVAGCFSRDAKANAATGEESALAPERVYPDWKSLIAAERGKIDFLAICTPNSSLVDMNTIGVLMSVRRSSAAISIPLMSGIRISDIIRS